MRENSIAATITLGARLDEGYPNPIYFPVMNSLVPTETSNRIDGNTLAATKIAHEFGHVNRTSKVDSAVYQLQGQLIPQYNKIFLTNGRNENDPRLLEMAQKIGGTPVQIWEDREYWGEANAMVYLRDRFTEESMRCPLFSKIRHSVDSVCQKLRTSLSRNSARHPFPEDLRLAIKARRLLDLSASARNSSFPIARPRNHLAGILAHVCAVHLANLLP